MKALITGANGFLGRPVVVEVLRRGHSVRALVRPATDVGRLHWPGEVEVFRADLRASRDLPSAFEGVDVLIHLAAGVKGSEDAQFAASVVGTERLLEAMAKSETRQIVLASSFSVYDWSAIRGELTEASPVEPAPDLYDRDGYAVAKVWQERVARRMASEHGWALTVLRPGFIWGRGNEYLAGLGQQIGSTHLVFGPSTRLPLTHVENCAHCFAEAAENPRAAGETFNVVDDEGPTISEYLTDYLRETGTRGLRLPIPYGLAISGVRLARWASKTLFRGKGKLPSILVPCRFEARFKPLRFGNRKLREVLGWAPPLGREERLRRTYGPPDEGPPPRQTVGATQGRGDGDVKFPDRRGLVNALLAASLLLNAAMIAYLANSGGLRRFFLKADLAELPPTRAEFQKQMEARYRKLPNTGAEVIFAGDSLVADGPWAEFYTEVHNRGIGGDTAAGLLGRLDEITEGRPRRLLLLVGANDLAAAVPVAQFLRHYREILERVRRESPATEVTVLGVLPVNPAFPNGPTYDNARVAEANRGLRGLVGEFPGVRFLDLSGALVDAAGDLRREFTTDGLHMNVDGYLAVREALRGPATGAGYREPTEETPRP